MTETAKKQDLSLLPTTTMTPDPNKEDDGFTLVQARNSSAERLKSTTTGAPPVEMTRKTSTGTNDDASTSNSFDALSDPEGEDEDKADVEEVDAEIVALVPSKVDKSKKKKKKKKNKNKNKKDNDEKSTSTPATDATTLASSKAAEDNTLVGKCIEIREKASNGATNFENSSDISTKKVTSPATDNAIDANLHNGTINPSDGNFLAKISGGNNVEENNGSHSDNSAVNTVILPDTGEKLQNGLNKSNNAAQNSQDSAQISKNTGNGAEDEQIEESAATIGENKDKAENSSSRRKETGENSEI